MFTRKKKIYQSTTVKLLSFIENYFTVKFSRKTFYSKSIIIYYKNKFLSNEVACVAMVAKKPDYWHITHIATNEKLRKKGYGKKVLKKIIKDYLKSDAKELTCNIRSINTSSQMLFKQMGFKKIEVNDKDLKPGFERYKYFHPNIFNV